jgi:hypothetical protein
MYTSQFTQWFKWYEEEQALQATYENMLSELEPLLTQRNNYLQEVSHLKALRQLSPSRWQAVLFDGVLRALKLSGCNPCHLVGWKYTGLQLEVVVKANEVKQKTLVSALLEEDYVQQVSLSPLRQQQQLQLNLQLVIPGER